ncbi:MAG: hypothetical protein JHC33_14650 [Ignisphaera sp.]|nr:hypothetical protein [Ignisphaera sp.]
MTENKIRLATIVLFIRSLLDELEPNLLRTEYVSKIQKRCKKYVSNNFKIQQDKDLLATIANESWYISCSISEIKEVTVSTLVLKLFDSAYRDELESKVGINAKHILKLYNATSDCSTLSTKIQSKNVANESIKNINKCIYRHFTKIQF